MNECKCIFWYIQVKTVTEISKISGTWKQQSRIVLRDQREISMTLCWIIDAPILNLVLREEETSFSISKFTHAINSKSNHLVKNTWKLFFFFYIMHIRSAAAFIRDVINQEMGGLGIKSQKIWLRLRVLWMTLSRLRLLVDPPNKNYFLSFSSFW